MESLRDEMESLIQRTEALNRESNPPKDCQDSEGTFSTLNLFLIGRIIFNCPQSLASIKGVTLRVWFFADQLEVKELKVTTFPFELLRAVYRHKVLLRHPWNFRGNLMVIKSWDPGLTWKEI